MWQKIHSVPNLVSTNNRQKYNFQHFWKHYLLFGLSFIFTCSWNYPSWSQSKNQQSRIVINSQVIDDKVTLRVKVTKNNKLISNLKEQDFSVYVDCNQQDIKKCDRTNLTSWNNPKQSTPLPSKIVVLLDLSGSMKQPDKGGLGTARKPKLQGAINAIKAFTKVLAERGGETEMVIVPFSDKAEYTSCNDYPVTTEILNRFAPASSPQHQQDLEALQNELNKVAFGRKNPNSRLCGETNLYQSLAKTINFLNNLEVESAQKANSGKVQPKLHIVLLSDGFNTVPFDENSANNICSSKHFDKLNQEYLQRSIGKIQIHTIGYGRTPSELGIDPEYRQVTRGQPAKCTHIQKFTNGTIREQFKSELVDQKYLQEIAEITGGISEFSGNAEEIAQKFQDILDTILGEYEMSYVQKGADTASEHLVRLQIASIGNEQVSYSMPFVFQVPFSFRLWTILLFIFLPLSVGTLLLYLLAVEIKKQAQ